MIVQTTRCVVALGCALLCASGCGERATGSGADAGSDGPSPTDAVVDARPVDARPVDAQPADAHSPDSAADAVCPVAGFTDCGGDLVGTWRFLSFCPEDQAAADALFEHPYDDRPACADRSKNTVEGKFVTEGTLRFGATEVTITTSGQMDLSYGYTRDCLAAVFGGGAAGDACASMAKPGKLSCSFDPAATPPCRCSATLPTDATDETLPYEQPSTTTVAFDNHQASYCAAGDLLTLDWAPQNPVSWRYWVLRREP